MKKPRRTILLALLALGPAGLTGWAAPLPFTVDDPDGHWKIVPMQKQMGPAVSIEAVVVRPGVKMRFIVLSSPKTDDGPDALKSAGDRLKASMVTNPRPNIVEKDATLMGHAGREQQFQVVDQKELEACDLFVFAREETWWGVFCVAPADAAAASPPPFELFHKKARLADDVVEMAPFRAVDTPLTGFPINFQVISDPRSGRIVKIIVNEVPAGTPTEQAGVRAGDEILSINGRKVQDFAVGLGKNSELGKIFLNRERGDEVQLEVYFAEFKKSHFLTLRVPSIREEMHLGRP